MVAAKLEDFDVVDAVVEMQWFSFGVRDGRLYRGDSRVARMNLPNLDDRAAIDARFMEDQKAAALLFETLMRMQEQ